LQRSTSQASRRKPMPVLISVNNDCAFCKLQLQPASAIPACRDHSPSYHTCQTTAKKLPRLQLERAYQSAFYPDDKQNSNRALISPANVRQTAEQCARLAWCPRVQRRRSL